LVPAVPAVALLAMNPHLKILVKLVPARMMNPTELPAGPVPDAALKLISCRLQPVMSSATPPNPMVETELAGNALSRANVPVL
jgi:hypothetical protein